MSERPIEEVIGRERASLVGHGWREPSSEYHLMGCDTCDGTGRCTYPSIDAQSLVVVACPDCQFVLPTVCNCTQDGQPYCGDPECDIDFCPDCGEEYTDPCPRHVGVDHV